MITDQILEDFAEMREFDGELTFLEGAEAAIRYAYEHPDVKELLQKLNKTMLTVEDLFGDNVPTVIAKWDVSREIDRWVKRIRQSINIGEEDPTDRPWEQFKLCRAAKKSARERRARHRPKTALEEAFLKAASR